MLRKQRDSHALNPECLHLLAELPLGDSHVVETAYEILKIGGSGEFQNVYSCLWLLRLHHMTIIGPQSNIACV